MAEAVVLPVPALAYCSVGNHIFQFTVRDQFAGCVFCPACSSRANPQDSKVTVGDVLAEYPYASVYRSPDESMMAA